MISPIAYPAVGVATIATILLTYPAPQAEAQTNPSETVSISTDSPQSEYWDQGLAEISRFDLEQSRYGEMRKGHMIQVFVKEDFLLGRQVKREHGTNAKRNAVPILKLNSIRRFNTGIYDYSMMRSVFAALDTTKYPRLLKVSASVQEWCGQCWLQFNLRKNQYQVTGHSYFDAEADHNLQVPAAWHEDSLWTRIRINPDSLPTGEVQMIPGVFDQRLTHRKIRSHKALVTLTNIDSDRRELKVVYSKLGRILFIVFETKTPHRIVSFREEQAATKSKPKQVTTGERSHQQRSAYWNQHDNKHLPLRSKLGLK